MNLARVAAAPSRLRNHAAAKRVSRIDGNVSASHLVNGIVKLDEDRTQTLFFAQTEASRQPLRTLRTRRASETCRALRADRTLRTGGTSHAGRSFRTSGAGRTDCSRWSLDTLGADRASGTLWSNGSLRTGGALWSGRPFRTLWTLWSLRPGETLRSDRTLRSLGADCTDREIVVIPLNDSASRLDGQSIIAGIEIYGQKSFDDLRTPVCDLQSSDRAESYG